MQPGRVAGLNPLPAGSEGGAGAVVVGDLGGQSDFATLDPPFRLLVSEARPPLVALGLTRYRRAEDGLRLDAGPFVWAREYAAGTCSGGGRVADQTRKLGG